MNEITKKIAGATGSLVLLSSMGMGAVTAFAEEAPEAPTTGAEAVEGTGAATVTSPVVAGTFAFTQNAVSSIDQVARMMRASSYLCGGAGAELTDVDAADWKIAVGGAVEHPYVTTVADIQADPAVQKVLLGCSCAGNPADGDASVAAQVTGVSVKLMLDRAGVADGANTVVFTSADGYEVALPPALSDAALLPYRVRRERQPHCRCRGRHEPVVARLHVGQVLRAQCGLHHRGESRPGSGRSGLSRIGRHLRQSAQRGR